MEQEFIVTKTSYTLGELQRKMTLHEIKRFDIIVYWLAEQSIANEGKECSFGGWSVRFA